MNVINAPTLGAVLSSFFNDYLKLQKGLRPNSIRSYADAMRLFLQFAGKTREKKITQLGLDDLDADLVSRFLNFLVESRGNAAQSRNLRLAALRTFFEYVGQRFPERLGQAQKVAAIPTKRTQLPETISSSAMRSKLHLPLFLPMVGMLCVTEPCCCSFTTQDLVYKRLRTSGRMTFDS